LSQNLTFVFYELSHIKMEQTYITWDNSNVPQNNFGIQAHPFFNTYTDFQKPYTYWTPQYNANNFSTSYTNMVGDQQMNHNYRYAAGYNATQNYLAFLNDSSIKYMSQVITDMLRGIHPEGKNIVVPNETIISVADSVLQNSPQKADVMQQMVISYIVDWIKTDFENTEKNNKYSIWVQKYDEDTGLQRFNDVKLNKKMRSPYMQWKY
jgi:hypothetical protein